MHFKVFVQQLNSSKSSPQTQNSCPLFSTGRAQTSQTKCSKSACFSSMAGYIKAQHTAQVRFSGGASSGLKADVTLQATWWPCWPSETGRKCRKFSPDKSLGALTVVVFLPLWLWRLVIAPGSLHVDFLQRLHGRHCIQQTSARTG